MKIELSDDPFGELSDHSPLTFLKQRFSDRVLVMTTDRCFSPCAHCTRSHILGRTDTADTPEKIAKCVEYVKKHPKVRDVLLSGGDVLTLPDRRVQELVEAFAALGQVEVIRICTRAPVAKPERITPALARLLAKSKKVWVNCHINTAAEVARCREAAARLVERGIPVSSQTVLLKGVNDTPAKMLALLRALSAARIRPYYVFQCDPVKDVYERFAVPLEKAKAIETYCAERIGGLALPRFVADLPGAKRKTPIELLQDGAAIFSQVI